MALSPIEMFRSNESSLTQILQGGSQTISGIMDKAIQIGRDMANNQRSQEQDLFAMRRNETALQQRRAENLQQNNEDAQRFARSAFENDRKFGQDVVQQGFENTRATTNDLFSQGMQKKNYDLNVSNTDADNTRADAQLGITKENMRVEREAREKQQKFYEDVYKTEGTALQEKGPFVQGDAMNNYGISKKSSVTPETEATLRIKISAATKAGDGDAANALMGQLARLPKGGSERTPEQIASAERAAQDQQFQVNDRAEKEIDERIKADISSFIPQEVVMAKRKADSEKYKDPTKTPSEVELAEAKVWDDNRVAAEKATAAKMTLPEYLAKGPQTAAAKKAREEVWKYVNGAAPSTTAAPDPTKSLIDKL